MTSSRRHWLESSHKSLALVGIGLGMCLLGSRCIAIGCCLVSTRNDCGGFCGFGLQRVACTRPPAPLVLPPPTPSNTLYSACIFHRTLLQALAPRNRSRIDDTSSPPCLLFSTLLSTLLSALLVPHQSPGHRRLLLMALTQIFPPSPITLARLSSWASVRWT